MNPHGLLPWFANGTLDSEETASFELHLAACERCRSDLEAVRKMQSELELHGDALLDDHPTAEELVAVVRGDEEIPANKARCIREHLALCATCGDEARWATGAAVATATRTTPGIAGWRSPTWGWAAAAVLLVALTVTLTTRGLAPPRYTGIVPMFLVQPTQRVADPETAIGVSGDATLVRLLLEVDLPPGAFPASLEVLDADETRVHSNPAVAADDLYLGRFLLFECARADCPDGSYVARVVPRSGRGPATRYPFRLSTEAEGAEGP